MNELKKVKQDLDRYNEIGHLMIEKDQEYKRQEIVVNQAYEALEKERNDVVELDENAIKKAFSKLINTYETKLEKETSEQKDAEEAFIISRKHLIDLKQELLDLAEEKSELEYARVRYIELLREKTLRIQEDSTYQKHRASILQYQYALNYQQEIAEHSKQALKLLEDIEKQINTAFGAAILDTLGVAYIADIIKYMKLSQFSNSIVELNSLLTDLNIAAKKIDYDLSDHMIFATIDVIGDNFIMDVISAFKIYDLKAKIEALKEDVKIIQKRNRRDMKDTRKKLSQETNILEDYIVDYVEDSQDISDEELLNLTYSID